MAVFSFFDNFSPIFGFKHGASDRYQSKFVIHTHGPICVTLFKRFVEGVAIQAEAEISTSVSATWHLPFISTQAPWLYFPELFIRQPIGRPTAGCPHDRHNKQTNKQHVPLWNTLSYRRPLSFALISPCVLIENSQHTGQYNLATLPKRSGSGLST